MSLKSDKEGLTADIGNTDRSGERVTGVQPVRLTRALPPGFSLTT